MSSNISKYLKIYTDRFKSLWENFWKRNNFRFFPLFKWDDTLEIHSCRAKKEYWYGKSIKVRIAVKWRGEYTKKINIFSCLIITNFIGFKNRGYMQMQCIIKTLPLYFQLTIWTSIEQTIKSQKAERIKMFNWDLLVPNLANRLSLVEADKKKINICDFIVRVYKLT